MSWTFLLDFKGADILAILEIDGMEHARVLQFLIHCIDRAKARGFVGDGRVDLAVGLEALESGALSSHIQRVVEIVVSAQLGIHGGCAFTLVPHEVARLEVINLTQVHLLDRKTDHACIVSDDLVRRDEVLALHTPPIPAGHSRFTIHHGRLIVDRGLLRTHLVGQKAREGRLIDARFRVLEGRLEGLLETLLALLAELDGLSALLRAIIWCGYHCFNSTFDVGVGVHGEFLPRPRDRRVASWGL